MEYFINEFKEKIHGVLHGFDRVIIKDHIPNFYQPKSLGYFLHKEDVKMKEYGKYVNKVSEGLKQYIESIKKESGCYFEY